MTATITPAEHLTIYPTTEQVEHQDIWVAGGAFSTLLDWVRAHDLTLEHDPESDETVTGYYVRDMRGDQVAAATLTDR